MRLNEMFGAGFVSLEYLTERMPGDVFEAWAAYVLEWDRRADERKQAAEHAAVMKKAARAAAGR